MSTAANPVVEQSDWRAGLPPELQSEKSLEGFKDVGALAKSFVDTKKMVGNAVRIPKDDAKPEEFDAFYSRLGRPSSPEDYEFKKPENLDEGVEKSVRSIAHKAGLAPHQAQAILDGYHTLQTERLSSQNAEMEAELGTLKKQWGNEYETKLQHARRAVNSLGDDNLKQWLDKTGMGNNPNLIRAFAKFGESLSEDVYVTGDHEAAKGTEGLKSKIEDIRGDKAHPYNNPDHPGHQRAIDEMNLLYIQAYS